MGFADGVSINRKNMSLGCGGLCFLAFYGGSDFLNFEHKFVQNVWVTTSELGFSIFGGDREIEVF